MGKKMENISDNELKKLGITRVSTNVYHVGPYKYSKLSDAIAETERNSSKQAKPKSN
jgi:hypothetical protein